MNSGHSSDSSFGYWEFSRVTMWLKWEKWYMELKLTSSIYKKKILSCATAASPGASDGASNSCRYLCNKLDSRDSGNWRTLLTLQKFWCHCLHCIAQTQRKSSSYLVLYYDVSMTSFMTYSCVAAALDDSACHNYKLVYSLWICLYYWFSLLGALYLWYLAWNYLSKRLSTSSNLCRTQW